MTATSAMPSSMEERPPRGATALTTNGRSATLSGTGESLWVPWHECGGGLRCCLADALEQVGVGVGGGWGTLGQPAGSATASPDDNVPCIDGCGVRLPAYQVPLRGGRCVSCHYKHERRTP
jgi:hypothetical protein